MSVPFLCFAISAINSEIDNIPIASARNELPLPSHPPHDVVKCDLPAVDSILPKIIWCMYFIDPSDTGIIYPFLSCTLSMSSIVVSILLYVFWSGVNVTNLMISMINTGWSVTSCSNNSGGPAGNADNALSNFSSNSSSLYTFLPADA